MDGPAIGRLRSGVRHLGCMSVYVCAHMMMIVMYTGKFDNKQKLSTVRLFPPGRTLRLCCQEGWKSCVPLRAALPLGPSPARCLPPAGRAEEKTGGRCQLPWREVYSEIPGRPGLLGSSGGGGRGGVSSRGRELYPPPNSGQRLYTVLGSQPGCTAFPTAQWA